MTRVGTTPAVAVHPASRELARPIRRSITRHSPIQVVSQKCLQPPDPAPHHSAPQNQISPQLVLSISESLATVAVTVPTRATIAVQLNLANGSHIARNCSKLAEMTRHLLIALQPRRVGAPHLVGMESNHLGYDSTAQSRQGAVVATRYPLFVQRKVSLPLTIQIKKEGERRFLLLTINTLNRRLWLRKIIHCRQPLVFWQPLSCSFGNLWVVYHSKSLGIGIAMGIWLRSQFPIPMHSGMVRVEIFPRRQFQIPNHWDWNWNWNWDCP